MTSSSETCQLPMRPMSSSTAFASDVERALPGADFSPTDALSAVLLDRDDSPYENLGDLDSVSANGIQVVRTQLATKAVPTRVDATRLSEILVSLA